MSRPAFVFCRKCLLLSIGGLFALLLLAVAGGLYLLRTDGGRAWLSRAVEGFTADGPVRVHIEGLAGRLPFEIRAERVQLGDGQGVWLDIEGLELDISAEDLLHGRFVAKRVAARSATVERAPIPPDSEPATGGDAFKLEFFNKLPPVEVHAFEIAAFRLSEALLGQELALRVEGGAAAGKAAAVSDDAVLVARLAARELDDSTRQGPPAWMRLDARLEPEPWRLDLNLDLHGRPNGPILSRLGIPAERGLDLRLRGNGPLAAWSGRLSLDAPGLAMIEARATELGYDPPQVRVQAEAEAASGLLPAAIETRLGRQALFQSRAHWQDGFLRLEDLRLDLPQAAGLQLHGRADFSPASKMLDANIMAQNAQPQLLLSGSANATNATLTIEGPLLVNATAQGRFDRPRLVADVSLGALRAPGVEAEALRVALRLDAAPEAIATTPADSPLARIAAAGQATALRWPGLAHTRDVNLDFQALIPDARTMELRQGRVWAEDFELRLAANASLAETSAAGLLELDVPKLSSFAEYLGPLRGSAELRVPWTLSFTDGQPFRLMANPGLALREPGGLPAEALTLLGPAPTLSATLDLADADIHVSDLRLRGQAMSLNGTIELLAGRDLDASLFADIPDLAVLRPAQAPSGPLRLTASLSGLLGDGAGHGTGGESAQARPRLQAGLRVEAPRLEQNGRSLDDIRVELKSANILASPARGELDLSALLDGRVFAGNGTLLLDAAARRFENLRLETPGLSLRGDLELASGEASRLVGLLELDSPDLSALADLGLPLAGGKASVSLGFGRDAAPVENGQTLRAELNAQELDIKGVQFASANATAELTRLFDAPAGRLDFAARDVLLGAMRLASLDASAEGGLDQLDLSARAHWTEPTSGNLRLQAAMANAPERLELKLRELDGELAGRPLKLRAPATLVRQGNSTRLTPLSLGLGPARLTASAELLPSGAEAKFDLVDLPLAMAADLGLPPANGTVAAKLRLHGSADDPQADFLFTLKDATLPEHPDLPADIQLDGGIEQQRLSARLEIEAPYGEGVRPGQGWVALPVEFSLVPPRLVFPPTSPLSGKLQAPVNLEPLPLIVGRDDFSLEGMAIVDLNLTGSVRHPDIDGTVQLQDGQIEHFYSGTFLEDLSGLIRVHDREGRLINLESRDGQDGVISANGHIFLDPPFPYTVQLKLDKARLVRRVEFDAQASGELKLTGDLDSARMEGSAVLDPAEVRIPDRLPAGVADLPVREVNAPRPEKQVDEGPDYPLALDTDISIPGRFFVRGQGLDSEWKGQLRVGGSADNPTLVGELHIIRGRYELLGKRFELERGVLTFTGASPPEPSIDLSALASGSDIEVQALINGPVRSPTVTLESDPPLPQDEILSRLLFGKELTRLTAMQALSLAQAASKLSGQGGGSILDLDVLDETRQFLQLDDLELTQSPEDRGFSVGAGTYLREGVYLELNKGLTSDKDRVRLKIELTPSVNLESYVGTDSEGGVGLNWKHDY